MSDICYIKVEQDSCFDSGKNKGFVPISKSFPSVLLFTNEFFASDWLEANKNNYSSSARFSILPYNSASVRHKQPAIKRTFHLVSTCRLCLKKTYFSWKIWDTCKACHKKYDEYYGSNSKDTQSN